MITCVNYEKLRPILLSALFAISMPVYGVEHADVGTRSPFALTDYNKGVQFFNSGNFEEAAPYFDKAIDHDAAFARAYYARALCNRELKRNDSVLFDLDSAIRLNPDMLDARVMRGGIRFEAQQADSALEDFNYVLERRPADAQCLLSRGLLYLREGRLSTAHSDFRVFLKLYPDNPLAPRLRKLLASLAVETSASSSPSASARRSAGRKQAGMPDASQQLAADLLLKAHELSETYNQKVIRGEHAEAVGSLEASEIPLNKE